MRLGAHRPAVTQRRQAAWVTSWRSIPNASVHAVRSGSSATKRCGEQEPANDDLHGAKNSGEPSGARPLD
jgi:hypothetical protein